MPNLEHLIPCSPLPCPPPASNHVLSSVRTWGADKQHVKQPAGSVRALSVFVQPCRTMEGLDRPDQHSNQGWCECRLPPQSWEEWTWSESSITLRLWTTCLSSNSSFHPGQSGGELRLGTTAFDFLQHFWEIRLSEIASLSTPPHFAINQKTKTCHFTYAISEK